MMATPKGGLLGRRYLVVEDEYLIASDLIAALEWAGATVLGPVAHVQHAMEVLVEPDLSLDAAVLDIHLVGETVFGVAQLLLIRKIPFVFVTGVYSAMVPKQFSHAPCLTKPVVADDLVKAISALAPLEETCRRGEARRDTKAAALQSARSVGASIPLRRPSTTKDA